MGIIEHCARVGTMGQLRTALQTRSQTLSAMELQELAGRIRLPRAEWQQYVEYDDRQFKIRTVFESSLFEVNLIGWKGGQTSSIHDHRGSACCVLVLDGIFTNRDYRLTDHGRVRQVAQSSLRAGESLARHDGQIHRCGNEQSNGENLATLHLYSPPLKPLSERRYR